MKEMIGKVTLNDKFYKGEDLYNDGDDIENEMLEIAKAGNWREVLHKSRKWPVLYHFSDIRGNLIEWYPLQEGASVLEIGCGCGGISGFLCRKAQKVVGIELSKRRATINAYRNRECSNLEILVGNFQDIELEEKFDYVTLIGVLEYAALYLDDENPYEAMLRRVQGFLKPNGKILIAIENKMGLKYLNGAREDHVGKRFAGVEDYRFHTGVRTFSKPELVQMFENCGICKFQFYYPCPDYKLPDSVYSDAYLPGPGEVRIWNTNYDMPRIALYNDAIMADQVCRDGMFGYFSNSFLAVCNESESKVVYAHYAKQRRMGYQTSTIIFDKEEQFRVEKRYACSSERDYDIFKAMNTSYPILQDEFKNITYLKPQVTGAGDEAKLEYGCLSGVSLEQKILPLLRLPKEKILSAFTEIIDYCFEVNQDMLAEFEITDAYRNLFGDVSVGGAVQSLKVSNLDMTLGNLMLQDDGVYCFDYEWVFDFPIPLDFLKVRCLDVFWAKFNMYVSFKVKRQELLQAVGIRKEDIPVYMKMEKKFEEFVYGEDNYSQYLDNYKKPGMVLNLSNA